MRTTRTVTGDIDEYLCTSSFAGTAFGLIIWVLVRNGRIYEYPFLIGAVWVGWLLPKAVGVSECVL
jgi:hypothetical protein